MPESLGRLRNLAVPRDRCAAPPAAPEGTAGDAELLARHRRGDPAALDELLDRYEPCLFPFLLGLLKDHHRAEDALQETWCRALEHLPDIDPHRLRGWLFTVAYHQAMLSRRKERNGGAACDVRTLPADADSCPAGRAERREAEERVRALLERLSPAQREVIRQRIFEGKRFRDIARDLDCPLNTALARMHEGLKRLRQLWGPDYV